MRLVCQIGRSSIEMLGVLAIVAVLSVVALSGYNKAMTKYKLNKYTHSVNAFVNNFIQFRRAFGYTPGGWTEYNSLMEKLNLIPEGMRFENNMVYDIFGNTVYTYHDNRSTTSFNHDGIMFPFDNSDIGSEACVALIKTAFENSAHFWQIYLQPRQGNGSYYIMVGDLYCQNNAKCLRNLSLDNIHSLCNTYRHKNPLEDTFQIQITFK